MDLCEEDWLIFSPKVKNNIRCILSIPPPTEKENNPKEVWAVTKEQPSLRRYRRKHIIAFAVIDPYTEEEINI